MNCWSMLVNLMERFVVMIVIKSKVIEACFPRLKVISKWGTGIDSIDKQACEEFGMLGQYDQCIHQGSCRYGDGIYFGLCPPGALDG